MNYISLKNGVLFRTELSYTWIKSSRSGVRMVTLVPHIDADDSEEPVNGEVRGMNPDGTPCWTLVMDFRCEPDDIQAVWRT